MKLRSGRIISNEFSKQKIVKTGEGFCCYSMFKKYEKQFRKQAYYEYGLRRANYEDMKAKVAV